MNYIYIVRAQKAAKYTLIAAVLIVPFHLTFISKDTFQFNRKDKIISKKLNWLQNNISIVQSKKCYTESVGVNKYFVSTYWFFRLGRKTYTSTNCKSWKQNLNLNHYF
jgi:hypothetical protein